MILVKYLKNDEVYWGEQQGEEIYRIQGSPYKKFFKGNLDGNMHSLKLLPPCDASKIVAMALNYEGVVSVDKKNYEPLVFLKGPNALVSSGDPVFYPKSGASQIAWVEAELAVLIGKRCRNVAFSDIEPYILGYTVANDLTITNVASRDHHLAYSKSPDTFCPLGPSIVTTFDPSDVYLRSWVNGEIAQNSSTKDLIFNVFESVSYISYLMTLEPGDVVLTGTPVGTGPDSKGIFHPGDTIEVEVEGIGKLTNRVMSYEV